MNDKFLNTKDYPNTLQVLGLFFEKSDVKEYLKSMNGKSDKSTYDDNFMEAMSEDLGEPTNTEVHSGSEWEVTRLTWDGELGPIYKILVKKLNMKDDMLDYNSPFEIEESDIKEMSYKELLEEAIKNEDFDEATRLRDWDLELKKLLKKLKPLIIKAIEDEDLDALTNCTNKINSYRNTL